MKISCSHIVTFYGSDVFGIPITLMCSRLKPKKTDPQHFEYVRLIVKWSNIFMSQPFFSSSPVWSLGLFVSRLVYYRFNTPYVKRIGKEHLWPMSYLENSVAVSTEINEALQQSWDFPYDLGWGLCELWHDIPALTACKPLHLAESLTSF